MSIFPELQVSEEEQATTVEQAPTYRTYAFDFERGEFVLQVNGKPVYLEGAEAIHQEAQKALRTERYTYPIYTADYGHELKELIRTPEGTREWKQAEAERLVREAVEFLPGVERCESFSFEWGKDSLRIRFRMVTEEGVFDEEVIV